MFLVGNMRIQLKLVVEQVAVRPVVYRKWNIWFDADTFVIIDKTALKVTGILSI